MMKHLAASVSALFLASMAAAGTVIPDTDLYTREYFSRDEYYEFPSTCYEFNLCEMRTKVSIFSTDGWQTARAVFSTFERIGFQDGGSDVGQDGHFLLAIDGPIRSTGGYLSDDDDGQYFGDGTPLRILIGDRTHDAWSALSNRFYLEAGFYCGEFYHRAAIQLLNRSRPRYDFSLFNTLDPSISPVPLPASMPLLLTGLGLAGVVARRRTRIAQGS